MTDKVRYTGDRRYKTKGAFYGILAMGFILALVSYHAADPSLNRVSDNIAENLLGVAGAYLADGFLQSVGFASAIFPLVFIFWAVRYLVAKEIRFLWLRSFFLGIALVTSALILACMVPPESWPYYVGLGGLMGDRLLSGMRDILPVPVLLFIVSALFFLSIVVASTVRWSEVAWLYEKVTILFGYVIFAFLYTVHISRKIYQLAVHLKGHKKEADEPAIEEKEAGLPVKKKKESGRTKVVPPSPPRPRKVAQQLSLRFDEAGFSLPEYNLLASPPVKQHKSGPNQSALAQNARMLERVLEEFGVKGVISMVRPGPVVTLYELEPSAGTKSSRVIGLADDIARSMSAVSARIAVIPGKNAIGIELPNVSRETVYLRELLETDEYQDKRIRLPLALGKDIGGEPVIADLSRMPHLLIAGTTGSGKSVAINTMILSFVFRMTPEECRFIMIDPKMLELSMYEGIPHLLSPVVTEPGKAVVALKWAVKEMENRYRLMSHLGVRNVAGYNKAMEEAAQKGKSLERKIQTGFDPETGKPMFETVPIEIKPLPFIVVIVDEMADLMLVAGKEIEGSIQRLAQMARAAGIHLITATQRPSVDVITGVIKANFPTRISFQVSSRFDSRTILGEQGAEHLLGMGDMLYMAGGNRITRVHGPFVDDNEVQDTVSFLKSQGKPQYVEDVTKEADEEGGDAQLEGSGDDLYDQAVRIVLEHKKASTSYIQRQLKIGYNRAANIIDRMEQEGVVGAPNHTGKREILVGP